MVSFRHFTAVALAAVTTPLAAQQSAAPQDRSDASSEDIIVVGRSLPESRAEVRTLTAKVSIQSDGQLARFEQPVCAAASGLPAQYSAIVARRIMAVARSVGAPVAGPGCEPNITVFFVESGHAVLEGIRDKNVAALSAIGKVERERLFAETGPVRVLTVTQLKSRDGDVAGTTVQGIAPGKEHVPILEVRSASIINLPTRQDINGVLVLIDIPATMGKSLGQIGSYAAMRTLARTREADAGAGSATILSLFDDANAPGELTAFDHNYLAALYKGPATQSGIAATSRIAGRINAAREAQR